MESSHSHALLCEALISMDLNIAATMLYLPCQVLRMDEESSDMGLRPGTWIHLFYAPE